MKEALYLRYGSEAPDKEGKPPALMTVVTVAQLMKLTPSKVNALLVYYFRPLDLRKRLSLQPTKLNAAHLPGT